jgi:hypothetical protein
MSHRDAEYERLLKELIQLEEDVHGLDLRDRNGWERHQQKIKIIRDRIGTFEKPPQRRGL